MCAENIVCISYIIDIEEDLMYSIIYFLKVGNPNKQTNMFNEHYRKPKTHKGQCCKTFQQNCIGWELVH